MHKASKINKYHASAVSPELFCNFLTKKLFISGCEAPFELLKTEGAVHFDTYRGMGVFKGGVNEIVDPSFCGDGWILESGANIDFNRSFFGDRCLRVECGGEQQAVARLKENILVAGGETRTISFYKDCAGISEGQLLVRTQAFNADELPLGERSVVITAGGEGWRRSGFVWDLPEGTKSYSLEIFADGLFGICFLDAFQSEAKDYFTPFFNGNHPGCNWVLAATPQHPAVNVGRGSLATFLRPRQTYFYRVSSVDNQGNESSASYEVKITPGRWRRKILLTWDRDPKAVKYRIYRGKNSRGQDDMAELKDEDAKWSWSPLLGIKPNAVFDLRGNTAICRNPSWQRVPAGLPVAIAEDTGAAHASRSLRQDPDVRLPKQCFGFDILSDFWLALEVEFGFANDLPFRPASFFEVGDPVLESLLAVSVRYFPKWGDEYPKILLVRMNEGKVKFVADRLPYFCEGTVIRLVAAQVYTDGELQAGAHLWYKIDEGPVNHLHVALAEPIETNPVITISKRFYYDYFANNSYCRMLAGFQGAPEKLFVYDFLQNTAEKGMSAVVKAMMGSTSKKFR